VADAKIVFETIRGVDGMDSTSSDKKLDFKPKQKYCLGVPKEYFIKGIDPQVEILIRQKLAELTKQGFEIKKFLCRTRNMLWHVIILLLPQKQAPI